MRHAGKDAQGAQGEEVALALQDAEEPMFAGPGKLEAGYAAGEKVGAERAGGAADGQDQRRERRRIEQGGGPEEDRAGLRERVQRELR